MAKEIKLRKGLDIYLEGVAREVKVKAANSKMYAVVPDDFYGLKPKVLAHEGDEVKAGDALFCSKQNEALRVVSPVSGRVAGINRGDRRKVLSFEIEADGKNEARSFEVKRPSEMSADEMKALLMESGLLAFFKMRPYDIVVNPDDTPKGVFVSAFSKMPLAANFGFVVKGQEEDFKTGIEALSRIAPVSVGICPEERDADFQKDLKAEVTVFDGPNPSGNVGVQINHLNPINKGEVAWTLGAEEVLFIGRLFREGRVDLSRTVAVGGSEINDPQYVETMVGASLKSIMGTNLNGAYHVRGLNGNPLVGTKTDVDNYLSAHATEVCVIPEGDDVNEVLGWIMPRLKDFSTSHSYFSWLFGKKSYNLDARVKGGTRHIIMSGEYDRVFPMNIYAGYLIKAILTGNIDRMEELGIYEVAPEDFAVAEFVDSSKLELQRIVREGLDMLRKEMA